MKKIKFYLVGMIALAIVAITSIGIGVKVNATTIPDHSLRIENMWSGSSGDQKVAPATNPYGVFSISSNTKTFTISEYASYPNTITNATGKEFSLVAKAEGSRTITISFDKLETAKIEVYCFSKDAKNFTINGVSYTSPKGYIVNKFEVDNVEAESIEIGLVTNVVLLGVDVYLAAAASLDEIISETISSINSIGVVTYSRELEDLIATATTKLQKCEANGISTDQISNYSVYQTAISEFSSLETAKISEFETKVSTIGVVSESSGELIDAASLEYDLLLDSTKSNERVIVAKATLTAAKEAYMEFAYEKFSKVLNVSDLDVKDYVENVQLGNSIFTVAAASDKNVTVEDYAATIDGVSYTKRLKFNGTITAATNPVRAITFDTKTKGILKIVCVSGSTSADRTMNVYNSSNAVVASCPAVKTASAATAQYVEIPSAGSYYFGSASSGVNLYEAEFIPYSTTVLQQEGTKTEENNITKYVRYIAIVDGVTSIEDITVSLAINVLDGETAVATLNYASSIRVVDRILDNGNPFTATIAGDSYTFDNKATTKYIIFTLAVSDTTHTDFVGKTLSAVFTVNGVAQDAKTYTIA